MSEEIYSHENFERGMWGEYAARNTATFAKLDLDLHNLDLLWGWLWAPWWRKRKELKLALVAAERKRDEAEDYMLEQRRLWLRYMKNEIGMNMYGTVYPRKGEQ